MPGPTSGAPTGSCGTIPTPQDWTAFDLPTRGAEPRYVSLLERDGQDTEVVLPYFRARKVAVMTLRSEAEIDALKAQAAK